MVSCKTWPTSTIAKHEPVELILKGVCKDHKVNVLKRPPKLSLDRVQGCQPPADRWEKSSRIQAEIVDERSLTEFYSAFVDLFTDEVLDAIDEPSQGVQHKKARRCDPEFKLVNAFGSSFGRPAAGAEARLWRELQRKIEQSLVDMWLGNSSAVSVALHSLRVFKPSVKPQEWPEWRKQIRIGAKFPHDLDFLDELSCWIGSLALRLENKAAADRQFCWHKWCRENIAKAGAPGIHRYMRDIPAWPQFIVTRCSGAGGNDEGHAEVKPQCDAESRAKPWHQLWETEAEMQELQWEKMSAQDVAKIVFPDYCQFQKLALTFPEKTAVRICGFHPRHFGLASYSAYLAVCRLWRAFLELALFPRQLSLLLIALLPKITGGDRPVGLFPSPIRLLGRWLRRGVGEEWRQAHSRPFFFGSKGAGSETCVWRALAISEYAAAVGRVTCSAMFDLIKAFEYIRHGLLLENARRYQFPLPLLRFLVLCYRMPRAIRVGGVTVAPKQATRAVVPGCACADLMMRLALLPTLDEVAEKFGEQISEGNFFTATVVDDIQFLGLGETKEAAQMVTNASHMLISGLRANGLEIDLTDKKLQVLCSDAVAADAVKSAIVAPFSLRARQFQGTSGKKSAKPLIRSAKAKAARNLGVDFSLRFRSVAVQRERVKKTAAKAVRLRNVKKAGVGSKQLANVAKAGLNSTMLYGAGLLGMSESALKRARSVIHSALCPRPGKRSATADLYFASPSLELDPAIAATVGPVMLYVQAVWQNWLPRHMVARAFMQAAENASEAKCKEAAWKQIKGPIAATHASLLRVGWSPRTPFLWTTPSGAEINILKLSAKDVATLFKRDVQNWLWQQAGDRHSRYASLAGAPLVEPINALLRKKLSEQWTAAHQGMLRAVVADAFEENADCPLCAQPGLGAWHLWICPALAVFRREYGMPAAFLECAERGAPVPLFSTALLPHPAAQFPMPLADFAPHGWSNKDMSQLSLAKGSATAAVSSTDRTTHADADGVW